MVIRNMKMDDYDAVYELWIKTPGMGLHAFDDSYEGISRYLKRNPTTCFIAENEGVLLGVILCGHDGRRGFIHHTAVVTTHRHQGIATALVHHVIAALKAEHIRKVSLVAFINNETGNAFWERMGFILRDDLAYRNKEITIS